MAGTGVKLSLGLVYIFLPTVSKWVCSALVCTEFDNDGKQELFLTSELTISCASELYTGFIRPYAWIMVLVWPIASPLLVLVMLWRCRDLIVNRTSRQGGISVGALSIFFASFDPDFWWFPVVDMLRRLCLTSLLLVINPQYVKSARYLQIQVALMISLAMCVLYREAGAYWNSSSDYLAYMCAWQIVLAVIALLFMDVQSEMQNDEMVLSVILITVSKNANVNVKLTVQESRAALHAPPRPQRLECNPRPRPRPRSLNHRKPPDLTLPHSNLPRRL